MPFYPVGTSAFSICVRGTQHAGSGGCGISGPVFGFLALRVWSARLWAWPWDVRRALLCTSGLALLALISASPEAAGWGAPALFQPTSWALACVGITAFESVQTGLGTALPDPRVPAGGPPLFGCPAVSGQSAFPSGLHFCLPFALCSVFLGTDLVTSHVALATKQLLCPEQPAS